MNKNYDFKFGMKKGLKLGMDIYPLLKKYLLYNIFINIFDHVRKYYFKSNIIRKSTI